MPLLPLYASPENLSKPELLMFSGGIERDHWHEMGYYAGCLQYLVIMSI